jgi:NAD(P)-dependent dehydrogenase (short-subunit alcohol dehydrogenase family)
MKIAVITGGRQGIGRGLVDAFLKAEYFVVTCGRHPTFSDHEAPSRLLYLQCDIGKAEDRDRFMTEINHRFEHIDVLINNAGVAPKERKDMLEIVENDFEWLLQTNLHGPFFLTQAIAKKMQNSCRSHLPGYQPCIINISSISAWTSSTNRAEYCIAKAGLSMMTQLFADRLAGDGIPVFEIQPGIIETPMTAGVKTKYDNLIENGLLPIHRWGTPEDIATAALTLAEGKIPYTTGQVLHIDGGFHIRRL